MASEVRHVESVRMALAELAPADYNPRKISAKAMAGLKASLTRFGELGGIVFNKRTGHLVGGHQRVKALLALGETHAEVRVVDLPIAEEKAANLALNHPGIGGEWDDALLAVVLDDVKRDLPTAFEELQLDDIIGRASGAGAFDDYPGGDDEHDPGQSPGEDDGQQDQRYTRKIQIPVYEPKGAKPAVADLFDTSKTSQLVQRINASNAPDEIKRFLRLAAERHTVFHFARIAEYYCHADADVQDLFDQSALVIIDYQKAIENGFVAFTEAMFKIADVEDERNAG
jgi:hypothetical protein